MPEPKSECRSSQHQMRDGAAVPVTVEQTRQERKPFPETLDTLA